jgi:Holliday junction resolvase RusA-like endonuclease
VIHRFTIEGTLPGLNDFIAKSTYNRFAYGAFKKQWTETCAWSAKAHKLSLIKNPVKILIHWFERNKKRDLDNVSGGGTKVILDGLVLAGILQNDTRQWVKGFEHVFPDPDPLNPRVEVCLTELPPQTPPPDAESP